MSEQSAYTRFPLKKKSYCQVVERAHPLCARCCRPQLFLDFLPDLLHSHLGLFDGSLGCVEPGEGEDMVTMQIIVCERTPDRKETPPPTGRSIHYIQQGLCEGHRELHECPHADGSNFPGLTFFAQTNESLKVNGTRGGKKYIELIINYLQFI